MSRSPNPGLTECRYWCGLNLEHCSKSQQLVAGYMYIFKKAESVSGLPRFVGSNLLACSVAITLLPLSKGRPDRLIAKHHIPNRK